MSSRRQPNLHTGHNQQQRLLGWPGAGDPWKNPCGALSQTTPRMEDGRAGSGDPDTHCELLTLYSPVSPLQSSPNRPDRMQVEGLGGGGSSHSVFVPQGKAIATYSIHCAEPDTPHIYLKFRKLLKLCVKQAHPQRNGPALLGRNRNRRVWDFVGSKDCEWKSAGDFRNRAVEPLHL